MVATSGSDYEWDIFVSYKHDPEGHQLMTPWVEQLLRHVCGWLRNELGGRGPRVFFDKDTIEIGSHWPDELRRGVLRSRCLLPILTPEYFQSRWCLAEWSSFMARQRLLPGHAAAVIAPVRFHDGEWFPDEAHSIQHLDLREQASFMPAFWNSPGTLALEHKIKPFAVRLARVIDSAPGFQDWPFETPDPAPPRRNVPMVKLW